MSMNKQVVIDMSDKIKGGSGRDMEQWFWRVIVLALLAQSGVDIGVIPNGI